MQVFIYLQNINKLYSSLSISSVLIIYFLSSYNYLEKDALLLCKNIINGQRTLNTSDKEKVNKMLNGEM